MATRRDFLRYPAAIVLAPAGVRRPVTLFLAGDVMTGRGIDQALPHPSDPRLREPYMKSALGYVEIAESAHGRIGRPVSFSYIWGEALAELDQRQPDLRIANLETSITTSEQWAPKGINYRMHPKNAACLTAARLDCCAIANNHVLDFGPAGLMETLDTLAGAGIQAPGAGRNRREAEAPAVLKLPDGGRVLVFAFGTVTSGIPPGWAATETLPGVNLLPDLSAAAVNAIAAGIRAHKRPGDIVVTSVHWGGNWGYHIPPDHREFARGLIDRAGVDVIHGHSSHHPKGIEIYRDRPILYGCGDFLNDYEGIEGKKEFRGELTLMYFVTFDPGPGRLVRFELTPMRIRRFRLQRAAREEAAWLAEMLNREGRTLNTEVSLNPDSTLNVRWRSGAGAPFDAAWIGSLTRRGELRAACGRGRGNSSASPSRSRSAR